MTRESWVSSSNRVMKNEASPEDLGEDTAIQIVFMDREEWVAWQKHGRMSKIRGFLKDCDRRREPESRCLLLQLLLQHWSKEWGGFHSNSVSVCQPHPSLMLFQNHSQKHSEPANSYITLTILFICHYPSNPLKLYPLAKDLGLIFKIKKLKSKISPRPICKQFLRVGSLS